MKHKFFLLTLALLLLPLGMVAAQSVARFSAPRFAITSGGAAGSASFAVRSAIGQPITDVANSASYRVSGGFLFGGESQIWLPMLDK